MDMHTFHFAIFHVLDDVLTLDFDVKFDNFLDLSNRKTFYFLK
jgi:hypothetical protein